MTRVARASKDVPLKETGGSLYVAAPYDKPLISRGRKLFTFDDQPFAGNEWVSFV